MDKGTTMARETTHRGDVRLIRKLIPIRTSSSFNFALEEPEITGTSGTFWMSIRSALCFYFIQAANSGILSYYQNEEEVNAGAKASIRVASCEILLDNVDNRR